MLSLLYTTLFLISGMHVKAQNGGLDLFNYPYSPKPGTMAKEGDPRITMIAGYQDLTEQEFTEKYVDQLEWSMARGDTFLLSDEPGTCIKAFQYFKSNHVDDSRIVVYTSSDTGTPTHITTSQIQAIAGGDTERYVAMAEDGSGMILWFRPGDQPEIKYQIEVFDLQFTGVKEAWRVAQAKHLRHMMWLYDQYV